MRTISHWGKQAIAIACGCAFGASGAVGWNPVLSFCAILLSGVFVGLRFASDPMERLVYDEQADVIKEGLPACVGLFFLTWIVAHTLAA